MEDVMMRRLLFVSLISSALLIIRGQDNLLDNSKKEDENNSSCTTQECKDKEFLALFGQMIVSETEAPPNTYPANLVPPMEPPPKRKSLLFDLISLAVDAKRALFGLNIKKS
ncbi:uncharacterized protein [Drosophila takahashii]|uniref:uncharacterized protein n=1 Tax=Drosophila takahashii TaxID=29030 RepID=UPI0007E787AB|nr:uncharacterized protein LOC108065454 [Drosophila takahashii]